MNNQLDAKDNVSHSICNKFSLENLKKACKFFVFWLKRTLSQPLFVKQIINRDCRALISMREHAMSEINMLIYASC